MRSEQGEVYIVLDPQPKFIKQSVIGVIGQWPACPRCLVVSRSALCHNHVNDLITGFRATVAPYASLASNHHPPSADGTHFALLLDPDSSETS